MKEIEKRNRAVKAVIGNFDFEKTASIMHLLDWRWATLGRTPNVKELKREAKHVLNMAWKSGYCSTGGLTAEKNAEHFSLRFEAIDSVLFID